MKPLGIKPIMRNLPAIDNLAWGKRALNGPNRDFYKIDYDLSVNAGNKKAERQSAKREICEAVASL